MSRILRLSDGASARLIEAGEGTPVLLIHGVGLRAEAWGPQVAALANRHHVIAVDMPGHGDSDPLRSDARLPDFVLWAGRVVEALARGPVSIAGHSMGALIAVGLAIERPDLVCRVALLNAVHRRNTAARAAVLARAADIAQGRGDPEAPLSRWFQPEDGTMVRDEVAGWLRSIGRDGYATAYRAFAEGDAIYADRMSEIRCPALVLTGALDANSTPEMSKAIASSIKRGRTLVVDGHRHMANITAPDAVNKALMDWLDLEPGNE